MTAPNLCPRCRRPLAADAPDGLCAACLFEVGAESVTVALGDASTRLLSDSPVEQHESNSRSLVVGETWGRYRIVRQLGRGGMGEVYEAEHGETGRRVALKVLRRRLRSDDDRARFLREGQLAASISHPHTVYIFGSEDVGGVPLISMELLPGGTLKDRVEAEGPLPVADAVTAVLDILGGLDAAQAAGILHRDIKPSNCFIDRDGSVKVGDFGLSISTLARDVRQAGSTTGFEGTPHFAAPEQLRGEPLDARADMYAVGATLFYLLTGRPPFEAPDIRDLFLRVTTEPAPSVRASRRDVPPGLAHLIDRCLAKVPADRPASYSALAEALRPFSRRGDAPAALNLRLLAGVVDNMFTGVALVVIQALAIDAVMQSTTRLWTIPVLFAYYALSEGVWGATVGKRLFGLRVASLGGGAPSWPAVAFRTSIFVAPSAIAVLSGASLVATSDTLSWLLTLALLGGLFLTARRANGWTALHDLASRTRVVQRPARLSRSVVEKTYDVVAASRPIAKRRYGPFIVTAEIWNRGDERLLSGFDPALRRRVWIHEVPAATPPQPASRQNVSRATRLHWLTGRRTATESWDAFEAPDGVALLTDEGPPTAWPMLRSRLLDLAGELSASSQELAPDMLGLDRLWLRSDGSLMLLDFPAPGSSVPPASASLTPVGLLAAVTEHSLARTSHAQRTPAAIPLSARALFQRWSSAAPPSIDDARTALIAISAGPGHVSSTRRSIPIALATAPVLAMLVLGLLLVPFLSRFLSAPHLQMVMWLEMLHSSAASTEGRLADPEVRDALALYIAGRYGEMLVDDEVWNTPPMPQFNVLRGLATTIATRHLPVAADVLERASTIVAPEIEHVRQRNDAAAREFSQRGLPTIAGTLANIALALVVVVSLVSSVITPGGLVTRLLGLAVTTVAGKEIGRLRSFARAVVAWLPALVWLTYLAMSPRIQGWVPTPAFPLLGLGITLTVLGIGAAWTIARPARGPHDWLTGTTVVPR